MGRNPRLGTEDARRGQTTTGTGGAAGGSGAGTVGGAVGDPVGADAGAPAPDAPAQIRATGADGRVLGGIGDRTGTAPKDVLGVPTPGPAGGGGLTLPG